MKRFILISLSLVVIWGIAKNSFATPSTQIWIPSTDVQSFGKFHLGIDNYTTALVKAADGAHTFPVDIGLTVGVLPWDKFQMEIGADLMEPSDEPVYLNAKVGVPEGACCKYAPAIAVGGFNFGTALKGPARNDYNMVYGLAAKNFPIVGRLSAGYYSGNADLLLNSNGRKDYDGALLSWDRAIPEISDKLWLAVDHQGGSNAFGATSVGGAWSFAPNTSLIVGYVFFNDLGAFVNNGLAGKDMLTTQLDVNF